MDYLPLATMTFMGRSGIRAVNIGPEIGAAETKCIINICKETGLKKILNKLIALFFESRKWEKWVSPDSSMSDYDKAIICGHYSYDTPAIQELLTDVSLAVERRGLSMKEIIIKHLKQIIKKKIFVEV